MHYGDLLVATNAGLKRGGPDIALEANAAAIETTASDSFAVVRQTARRIVRRVVMLTGATASVKGIAHRAFSRLNRPLGDAAVTPRWDCGPLTRRRLSHGRTSRCRGWRRRAVKTDADPRRRDL